MDPIIPDAGTIGVKLFNLQIIIKKISNLNIRIHIELSIEGYYLKKQLLLNVLSISEAEPVKRPSDLKSKIVGIFKLN